MLPTFPVKIEIEPSNFAFPSFSNTTIHIISLAISLITKIFYESFDDLVTTYHNFNIERLKSQEYPI